MTMKSLFSPSPSSSTSFDANNMCTSGGGCLVGVLRRLLRSGSLPTHPSSDRIDDVASIGSLSSYNGQKYCNGVEAATATPSPLGPGLVARLMGLDSMPDFNSIGPNSVLRSRSMNSAECFLDQSQILEQGQHRRAKTSVSFREMPTFIDQENDDYLVLSFEELEHNERECEMGSRKVKQRRSRKCKNKENRTETVSDGKKKNQETEESQNRGFSVDFDDAIDSTANTVPRLKPLKHKESSDEEQSNRRRRKKKKMSYGGDTIQKLETESSSEDSSPVSVLDFSQLYDTDPEFQSDLNSRRKLSQQLAKHEQPSPSSDQETEASEGSSFLESRKQDSHSSEMGLWGSICRLAREDMVTESNWSYRRTCNFEDFGDMCEDLEVQILDQLFHELVLDQLCWS